MTIPETQLSQAVRDAPASDRYDVRVTNVGLADVQLVTPAQTLAGHGRLAARRRRPLQRCQRARDREADPAALLATSPRPSTSIPTPEELNGAGADYPDEVVRARPAGTRRRRVPGLGQRGPRRRGASDPGPGVLRPAAERLVARSTTRRSRSPRRRRRRTRPSSPSRRTSRRTSRTTRRPTTRRRRTARCPRSSWATARTATARCSPAAWRRSCACSASRHASPRASRRASSTRARGASSSPTATRTRGSRSTSPATAGCPSSRRRRAPSTRASPARRAASTPPRRPPRPGPRCWPTSCATAARSGSTVAAAAVASRSTSAAALPDGRRRARGRARRCDRAPGRRRRLAARHGHATSSPPSRPVRRSSCS